MNTAFCSRSPRTAAGLASALALGLVLTSCASATPEAADGEDSIPVTFVEGLDVFPYEVVSVAIDQGFFEENGITAEIVNAENEFTAIASDSAQFAIGGTLAVFDANDEGLPIQTIFASMDGLGMNTLYSNALVEEAGLTADSPLEEKLLALEGHTIGLTGPGGDDETFFRWFLNSVGLDPDTDVSFAYIGGTADRIAAMDAGSIDAYMSSIPAAELGEFRGVGQRMIVPAELDIPEIDGIPYSGVHVTRTYAEENPDVVESVGAALAEAANWMVANPDETITFIESIYPDYDPAVVEAGMNSIFPAIPESGRMTQDGWDKLAVVAVEAGIVDGEVDTAEGVIWTNDYLPE